MRETHLDGNVERYRHDRVHDYRVGEEHEESDNDGAGCGLRRHQRVPRQVHLEVPPHQPLPHTAGHGTEHAHRQQEEHYLYGQK